jgi:hypothetical protein
MTNVVALPSIGLVRGAIVRLNGEPPNMLVVRSLFDTNTTAVVVCEGDGGGTPRLREYPIGELTQVLAHE